MKIIVEPSHDTPLVWFEVAIRGGASADPIGLEGMHRHTALLASRGAGQRRRAELEEFVEGLGAAVDMSQSRDALALSGLCLSRHLDTVSELAAQVLSEPRFDEDEHERLLRETPQILDEIRDDDSELASRWFDWSCAPGHPYGRTALGTEKSIAAIGKLGVEGLRALWKREVVQDNVVIGIAGDVDDQTAHRLVRTLTERLPKGSRVADLAMPGPVKPGRRAILVDKPDRTQAQLRIGHLGMRYGHPDTAAIAIADAAFGGIFSSRLMQEVRVKRGWSYGAGCAMRRSRLPHWFEIWTACDIEVTGQAIALELELYDELAAKGITDDEFDLVRSYLVGAMPRHVATARQRMQLAIRDELYDLPSGYTTKLPERFANLTAADVRAACARHFQPQNAVTVAVTTAAKAREALEQANAGPVTVVRHDEY